MAYRTFMTSVAAALLLTLGVTLTDPGAGRELLEAPGNQARTQALLIERADRFAGFLWGLLDGFRQPQ